MTKKITLIILAIAGLLGSLIWLMTSPGWEPLVTSIGLVAALIAFNSQEQTIVINQGITYKDAKNIAVDVFKSNYPELSEKAAPTARQRAEELIDDFLTKIQERKPEAINSMEDPGMQYAIFTAQKEYAKTGDKDLSDMLVDILVDRAAQQERNLKQIVLDESLSIVPKLTISQLDTLTLIFILKYLRNFQVINIPNLKDYLNEYIAPFTANLSKELSLYQHLEFAGCGSISLGFKYIEDIFLEMYKGIFCKGFTKEQFESAGHTLEQYPTLIIPCLQDATKFQVNALNDKNLETEAKLAGLGQEQINKLTPFLNNYQMNPNEVEEIIKAQGDFMAGLFDVWITSSLKNMTLTSVGIAIAIANLRRKTGITLDLGIWIK